MSAEKITLTNIQVKQIKSMVDTLINNNVPFGLGLAMNSKALEKPSEILNELLNKNADDYCTLSSEIPGITYKVTDDLMAMYQEVKDDNNALTAFVNSIMYGHFDAGDKQEEYAGKIEELMNEEVEVELEKIYLDRTISADGKEMTLWDYVEQHKPEVVKYMMPLLDIIIFKDKE